MKMKQIDHTSVRERVEEKLFNGQFANPVMEMNFSISPARLSDYIHFLMMEAKRDGWEERKQFDIKLLKSMPSYWVDRMIRTIKNAL